MLTPLQQRVRAIVAELPEADTVALAGDKLLALFGRAEPRDFIDAHALAARIDLADLYRLASDKDPGFNLERLCEALGVFDHHPRQAFPITDADYDQLRHWVHQWRNGLAESD